MTGTFLDVGWDLGQVLTGTSWLASQISGASPMVLVSSATVPGLRRLETASSRLDGTSAVAVATGRARSPMTEDRAAQPGPAHPRAGH